MKDEGRNLGGTVHWRLVSLALFSSFILHPSSFLHADSVFFDGRELQNVAIADLRGDSLIVQQNGKTADVAVSSITRIAIPGEAPLNDAEQAYAAGDFDAAVEAYQKSLRTTQHALVKKWSARRLIDAANKSRRFDAASSAYVTLLCIDPAAAAGITPILPDSRSTFLDTAVAEVDDALRDPRLSAEQRRALLAFLVDLHRARKDRAAEDAAYAQLAAMTPAHPAEAQTTHVLAKRRLDDAAAALGEKDYRLAAATINSARGLFTDPLQQADALYIIAAARHRLAGTDATALKDAALDYMRVVALAENLPGKPHVAEALMNASAIMQQLGEPQAARRLADESRGQIAPSQVTPDN